MKAILTSAAAIGFAVSAAHAAPEVEGNDTFATAQAVANGVFTIEAELEALGGFLGTGVIADDEETLTLFTGSVEFYGQSGLTPNEEYLLLIDNSASGVDTVVGYFDENGFLVDTADDGSPLGNGFGSALLGVTDANGDINVDISGFSDFDFDGIDDDTGVDHTENGDFTVELFLSPGAIGDVDFFTFSGLTPGDFFEAEITSGNLDTVLGLFDESGLLLDSDDDSGTNTLSLLTGLVPSSGVLTFAVSGFSDFEFDAGHLEAGAYEFQLTTNGASAVPVPPAIALFLAGLGGLGFLGRRQRA